MLSYSRSPLRLLPFPHRVKLGHSQPGAQCKQRRRQVNMLTYFSDRFFLGFFYFWGLEGTDQVGRTDFRGDDGTHIRPRSREGREGGPTPGPLSWACEHPIACRGPEDDSALVYALPARTLRHSHARLVSAPLVLVGCVGGCASAAVSPYRAARPSLRSLMLLGSPPPVTRPPASVHLLYLVCT